MKKKILAVLLVVVSILSAEMIKVYPSDDMYIDKEHNEPTDKEQLWVANFNPSGHFERIQLKFDLSEYTSAQIDGATLNIKRFFGCPSGGATICKFYAVTQYWDEIMWNEHTHVSYDEVNVYATHNYNENGWHSTDLTELVKKWADSEIDNFGVVMKANPNCKFSKFYANDNSNEELRPYMEIDKSAEGVEEVAAVSHTLINNYPNPFNPETRVEYDFGSRMGEAKSLIVMDYTGAEVARYVLRADKGSINFSGKGLVSGVYYASLTAGKEVLATRKMLMVK